MVSEIAGTALGLFLLLSVGVPTKSSQPTTNRASSVPEEVVVSATLLVSVAGIC